MRKKMLGIRTAPGLTGSHVLFHGLSRGLGPGIIQGRDRRRVEGTAFAQESRFDDRGMQSQCRGMWNVLLAIDNRWLASVDQRLLAITELEDIPVEITPVFAAAGEK
jgi:hypothetical protein